MSKNSCNDSVHDKDIVLLIMGTTLKKGADVSCQMPDVGSMMSLMTKKYRMKKLHLFFIV